LAAEPPPYDSGRQQRALEAATRLLKEGRRDLLWHHELGVQLGNLAEGAGYGDRRAEELARALGLSRVSVYQHRQFVSRYPERAEVRDLLRAGLSWAHVVALLPVADGGDRRRLQRAAAEQRWSVDRLRLEVRGLRQAQASSGAGRRQPDAAALLKRLEDATAAWVLAHDALQAGDDEGSLDDVRGALRRAEDPALRTRLASLLEALDRLQVLAGSLRDRLRALRGGRPKG
jgi:hypothetical protein